MSNFLLCLVIFHTYVFRTQASKIECKASAVQLTKETNLTCYFPEDLIQTQKDFSVYHYEDKERLNAVVECFWLSGQHNCITLEGYEIDKNITNIVTVRIPNMMKSKTGIYLCSFMGVRNKDNGFCKLEVTKTTCKVFSIKESQMVDLTCYFPEDISKAKEDFVVYHYKDEDREAIVVDCFWMSDDLHCYTSHGYKYKGFVNNQVTFQITQLTKNETGKYKCSKSQLMAEDVEFCEFLSSERRCEVYSRESTSESELTCYFPEDVGQSKKDFAVLHFDGQGGQDVVIDCFWHIDSLICNTQPGYQGNMNVSNRFVAKIPHISERETESYMCGVSGSSLHQVFLCSSHLKDGKPMYDAIYRAGFLTSVTVIVGLVVILLRVTFFRRYQFLPCKRKVKLPPPVQEWEPEIFMADLLVDARP